MSFWADCVKFVRSGIFKDEVIQGRTPFRFESIEITVPAGEELAEYDLDYDPAYCIVSLSDSDKDIRFLGNAVAFFSYNSNSVFVLHRELIDHPVKYRVDIMYI